MPIARAVQRPAERAGPGPSIPSWELRIQQCPGWTQHCLQSPISTGGPSGSPPSKPPGPGPLSLLLLGSDSQGRGLMEKREIEAKDCDRQIGKARGLKGIKRN